MLSHFPTLLPSNPATSKLVIEYQGLECNLTQGAHAYCKTKQQWEKEQKSKTAKGGQATPLNQDITVSIMPGSCASPAPPSLPWSALQSWGRRLHSTTGLGSGDPHRALY